MVNKLREEKTKIKKKGEKGFYALFVDFQKAFDSISRRRLLEKLSVEFELHEPYIKLISCLLADNKIRFNVNVTNSMARPAKSSRTKVFSKEAL